MKRLFIVIIFFISYCFSAQTQRFLFEFSYKLDSTAEHKEKENYILDVTSKEVKFYPQEFISIDSLNKISRELTKIALPNGFNTIVKRKFLETNFGDKLIKVSLEQFNNLLLNDYYNVYGNLKAMPEGEWSMTLENGKKINTLAELNMLIRETKNKIRKNYNPINKEQGIKYPLE